MSDCQPAEPSRTIPMEMDDRHETRSSRSRRRSPAYARWLLRINTYRDGTLAIDQVRAEAFAAGRRPHLKDPFLMQGGP